MANHSQLWQISAPFHAFAKTNRLAIVLPAMAMSAMFPDLALLPSIACAKKARKGSSTAAILAKTGDM